MCPEREMIVSGIFLHTPFEWVFVWSSELSVIPLFHMHVVCQKHFKVETIYSNNHTRLCLAACLRADTNVCS